MWTIDRFEGEMAVIESEGKTFNIPKWALPEGVKEGDVLKVSLDQEEMDKRKTEIKKLQEELFK